MVPAFKRSAVLLVRRPQWRGRCAVRARVAALCAALAPLTPVPAAAAERAIVGPVGGLAARTAMASSLHKQQAQDVASWNVGTLKARDQRNQREGVELERTNLLGGKAHGGAGGHGFTGVLDGDTLQAGRSQFRIERQGKGVLAVDTDDAGHRSVLARNCSGY